MHTYTYVGTHSTAVSKKHVKLKDFHKFFRQGIRNMRRNGFLSETLHIKNIQ